MMTALPVVMIFFTYKFPAAICLYWMTSNIISLGQSQMLRTPKVREFFKIPKIAINTDSKAKIGGSKKGFVTGMRESIDNLDEFFKMKSKAQFGRDYDEQMFKEAGTKKIKAFKYDP